VAHVLKTREGEGSSDDPSRGRLAQARSLRIRYVGREANLAHAGRRDFFREFRTNCERLTADSHRCSLPSPSQDEVFRERRSFLERMAGSRTLRRQLAHRRFSSEWADCEVAGRSSWPERENSGHFSGGPRDWRREVDPITARGDAEPIGSNLTSGKNPSMAACRGRGVFASIRR
jgi:hypothetical protein